MRPVFILLIAIIFSALQITVAQYYNNYGRTIYRQYQSPPPVYRHARQSYSNYEFIPALTYQVPTYKSPPPIYYHSQPVIKKVVYKRQPAPPPPQLDYGTRLYLLAKMICTTFKDMGDIALEDDWELGSKIVDTLKYESKKVGKILSDYRSQQYSYLWHPNAIHGRRYKRQAASDPMNQMGDVLVGSNSKIDKNKKKLSAGAQKRINKKYKDGVKNCSADSCKAAAALLASVEDAESERQRRRR